MLGGVAADTDVMKGEDTAKYLRGEIVAGLLQVRHVGIVYGEDRGLVEVVSVVRVSRDRDFAVELGNVPVPATGAEGGDHIGRRTRAGYGH